jgi:glycine/D-amino acid oxidase-like deaminating enzyme/nitrite reductase/ring-hydroxylating ferredoxin subunit
MSAITKKSYWEETASYKHFDRFSVSRFPSHFDCIVIGAGITGLTCAYRLKKRGMRVAVLEAGSVGGGATCSSSAHVTAYYDHGFHALIEAYGKGVAKLVCSSLLEGMREIEENIIELGIDCEKRSVPAVQYCEEQADVALVEREEAAARIAGLLVAPLTQKIEAPLPMAAGFQIPKQLQLHIGKYIYALAQAVQGNGCAVFEGSRVRAFSDGSPCTVSCDDNTLTAETLVLATHTPMGLHYFQTKIPPYRSFIVTCTISDRVTPALYYDTAKPYHYLRIINDVGTHLMVGGEDIKIGHGDESRAYARLEAYVKSRFDVLEVTGHWAATFYDTIDHLPLIGALPGKKNVFCATGFSGDGLPFGSVAGKMLAAEVLGETTPCTDLYRPGRLGVENVGKFVSENADSARCFIGDRIASLSRTPQMLAPGQGCVATQGLESVATYCDESGNLNMFSAVCPHMRCLVRWNATEKSFDCPCHGSRFDVSGCVMEGPAMQDLAVVAIKRHDSAG